MLGRIKQLVAAHPWHALAIALGLYLLSGTYVVPPRQVAVVQHFGKVTNPQAPPGLHWRAPWPMGRVQLVNRLESRRVTVGAGLETELMKTSAPSTVSQFLTGDENIINLTMVVQYHVEDPVAYLFAAEDVDKLVAAAVSKALTRAVAETDVDSVLTVGRVAIQQRVLQEARETVLGEYGLGVTLDTAQITVAAPPPEVADAFRAVQDAREDRERIINLAETYAMDVIPRAQGEADRMLREAEAYKQQVVEMARGEAERFTKLVKEYRKAPTVTRKRLLAEMAEEVLPKLRVIVVDDEGGLHPIDLNVLRRER